MKYTAVITDTAAADIAGQFTYIHTVRQQPLNAEKWLRAIYAAVYELEDFAGYARAPERDLLNVELRQKIFKSHRIIYSLDDDKCEVVIHYVRHGAQRPVGEPTQDVDVD